MARSHSWRSLSGAALKVYVELRCRFTIRGDGRANNNGELALSLDEASRLLGLGKSTVARALAELEVAGFIAKTKAGHWYGRKATQYRVTDEPWNGQPATREWKERERTAKAEPVVETWKPERQEWESGIPTLGARPNKKTGKKQGLGPVAAHIDADMSRLRTDG